MIRNTALIATLLLAIGCHASDFRFEGASRPVISIAPEPSSGLKSVYVAFTTEGLTVSYSPTNTSDRVTWYSFGTEGAAYAEQLSEGNELSNLKGNRGYIAQSGNRRDYFWLIDYSENSYAVDGISISTESDCSSVEILISGIAPRLSYTAINGRQIEIDRQITLSFYTLCATNSHFEQIQVSENLPFLRSTIHAESPLCSTRFQLSGDRFTREWGMDTRVESTPLSPAAVSAITSVKVESRDFSNEQSASSTEIGGSAPVSASFSASVSDGVVFTEWQLASDEDFNNVILRERSTDFVHIFNESGSFYVKFVVADATGACMWESEPYHVELGESRLLCPNAFSPGASEGINDLWCVSYRSIIEFDCSIFNRWGTRLIRFTDPSQGWDGRYKGRLVDPGVYYYVIKARGADGKIYNLSGDINIVGCR